MRALSNPKTRYFVVLHGLQNFFLGFGDQERLWSRGLPAEPCSSRCISGARGGASGRNG